MKILVAGLGLIGGSVCKAVHAYTDHSVYGWNRTKSVAEKALAEHVMASSQTTAPDLILSLSAYIRI